MWVVRKLLVWLISSDFLPDSIYIALCVALGSMAPGIHEAARETSSEIVAKAVASAHRILPALRAFAPSLNLSIASIIALRGIVVSPGVAERERITRHMSSVPSAGFLTAIALSRCARHRCEAQRDQERQ